MENKLRECFEDMVVYKDLKKSNFFFFPWTAFVP